MRLTLVTALFLLASRGASADYLQPRQDFISSLLSAFGPGRNNDNGDGPGKTTSSPKPSKTQSHEPTSTKKVETTTSRAEPSSKSTPSSKPSSTSTDTDTKTKTDTSTITSSATVTETTATSTSPTSTVTSTSAPINPSPSPAPAQSGGISSAGIAVAVVFSIVIVLIIAWVTFRYHPKCRAWWLARQEEKYKKRSYRDALDGPNAGSTGGGLTRGRTGLQSFFQPKSARSQGGGFGTIKRKTIHWGAPSPKVGSPDVENGMAQTRGPNHNAYGYDHGMERAYTKNGGTLHNGYPSGEKVPLAELASPMGTDREPPRRHEVSPLLQAAVAHSPSMSPVSPVSGGRKSLGNVSSTAGSTHSSRTGSMQTVGHRPNNRESKALPQVKVNGQVIYELGA